METLIWMGFVGFCLLMGLGVVLWYLIQKYRR